jgi:nitrogen regulatory protein P-II 2
MNTHPMNRVTVICEALAREPVLRLLKEAGGHGWTLWEVEGSGSWGMRTGDIPEFSNIQVEVILPPSGAADLLQRLSKELFPKFAMIAYETEIRVLRPAKF